MLKDANSYDQDRFAVTHTQGEVERRNHVRLRVQDGCYAAPHLQFGIVGRILNISRSGLSFRYVSSQERSRESSELSILSTDGTSRLGRIPYRTIWDSAAPGEFSCGAITQRHCGVQFEKLTPIQKSDLEHFIQGYIMD